MPGSSPDSLIIGVGLSKSQGAGDGKFHVPPVISDQNRNELMCGIPSIALLGQCVLATSLLQTWFETDLHKSSLARRVGGSDGGRDAPGFNGATAQFHLAATDKAWQL
jgi:hypothetical protein